MISFIPKRYVLRVWMVPELAGLMYNQVICVHEVFWDAWLVTQGCVSYWYTNKQFDGIHSRGWKVLPFPWHMSGDMSRSRHAVWWAVQLKSVVRRGECPITSRAQISGRRWCLLGQQCFFRLTCFYLGIIDLDVDDIGHGNRWKALFFLEELYLGPVGIVSDGMGVIIIRVPGHRGRLWLKLEAGGM